MQKEDRKNASEEIVENDNVSNEEKQEQEAKITGPISKSKSCTGPKKLTNRKVTVIKEKQKTIFTQSSKVKNAKYIKKSEVKIPKNKSGFQVATNKNKLEEKLKSDENDNTDVLSSKTEFPRNKNSLSVENLKETNAQNDLPNDNKIKQDKVKVISSRYMLTSKQKSRHAAPVLTKKLKDRKDSSDQPNSSGNNNVNTPDVKKNTTSSSSKKTQVTSTPSTNLLPLSNDMSSIVAETLVFDDINKHKLDKPLLGNVKNKISSAHLNSQKTNPVVALPSSGKASAFNPSEILYCQYLQALFLETKAKNSLRKKSENALEQLYGLWELNQELSEEENKLDLQIALTDNVIHVNSHLYSQEERLEPVTNILFDLEQECENLAKAIDTTRHQLPIKDIFLPDMKDLACTLDETEYLTELMVNSLKPSEESLIDLASILTNIEHTMETEMKELKKSSDLMKVISNLTIEESSLQIQNIQENEI
ncbi:HAUS augmin-like complex subunit 8 isoform X2 [Centruroides vittatus]|uniref:HAUS augmin-like complex subunit 8 isoform X2 n=1 Tax=Centruroides vittatus TaxID=120091 RepID=UPI00350E9257